MRSITIELNAMRGNEGCWEWPGSLDADGYGDRGRKAPDGLSRKAHRAAYEATMGTIPSGLIVRHTCDNRACIRPDHLLLGTQADNVGDAVSRGRISRGESSGTNKLTANLVRMIRRRISRGERQTDLAAEVGVARSTICDIAKGRTWSWLTTEEARHG